MWEAKSFTCDKGELMCVLYADVMWKETDGQEGRMTRKAKAGWWSYVGRMTPKVSS